MTSTSRASLSKDILSLRQRLPALIRILELKPDWYGSVFVQKKSAQSFSANLKTTQMNDSVSLGAVLRIYDGYTLYERATDELDTTLLEKTARQFAERVLREVHPANAVLRPYRPATWAERLRPENLDPEILSQIPGDVSSETPVHFGVRYEKSPYEETSARLARLKGILARIHELAPQAGLDPKDLTYIMARETFAVEESVFVDRESDLSQTLLRLSLSVATMSGSDRTSLHEGGLGGLEAAQAADAELLQLLRDLKALKSAEKLQPGKYRVLFGPVLTGVLAHEAFGHSQEGDTCARGRSKAWELHQTGARVGNEHATILNNPAIFDNGGKNYAAWGSYYFDEEGWLAREQVLLDRGQLKAPMTNLTSAIRLGVPRTANGKRESWANGVYTRQTNTYFSPGDQTLGQLMKTLDDGFVALHPAGGMEDPKGMGIQVGISYLQEVKKGVLTGRVFKGPAGGDIQMTGYTPDVLHQVVAKSKIEFDSSAPDQARHPFNDAGGCGKYHKEFVHAGCGGPYVLLDEIILG